MTASPRQTELVIDSLPDDVLAGFADAFAEFVLLYFRRETEETEARDKAEIKLVGSGK